MIIGKSKAKIDLIMEHIEQVLEKGNGVLVHSYYGLNRSVTVIAAFLMNRYKWSAKKSLEFLKMKKHTIDLRKTFFKQLLEFEDFLKKEGNKLTKGWFPKKVSKVSEEELMMNNTYLNTKMLKAWVPPDNKVISTLFFLG